MPLMTRSLCDPYFMLTLMTPCLPSPVKEKSFDEALILQNLGYRQFYLGRRDFHGFMPGHVGITNPCEHIGNRI
jgi:hypothetical protein